MYVSKCIYRLGYFTTFLANILGHRHAWFQYIYRRSAVNESAKKLTDMYHFSNQWFMFLSLLQPFFISNTSIPAGEIVMIYLIIKHWKIAAANVVINQFKCKKNYVKDVEK